MAVRAGFGDQEEPDPGAEASVKLTYQRTWQPYEERLVVLDRLGSRRNPGGVRA